MKRLIILIELIIILLLIMIPEGKTEIKVEAKEKVKVEIKEEKYFIMSATGYCPCKICCGKWHIYGKTYNGNKAKKGCVAIDPDAKILKLGQRIFIEEYGEGICNDVGGAVKGWEIDLCFNSHQEAVEWGRQLVKVYIID